MSAQPVIPMLHWSWEPSILIGIAGLSGAYILVTGMLRRRFGWGPSGSTAQQAAFHLGSLIVLIALCSPIDGLGDEYLFSVHMTQHMLLTFVAPPLWLLGIPAWLWEKTLARRNSIRFHFGFITLLVAFFTFNGVMWAWHLPAAYDYALAHEWVHIIEHLTFIGAALIGWAPALIPSSVTSLTKPAKALYLFGSTFSCTALAAMFTLSNHVFYPFYQAAPRAWGITALADQQAGGLIMWLPGDMILMAAILLIFGQWLAQQERAGNQTI